MKKLFDTSFDCKLEGKLAACFATAGCMWGGVAQAILTVLQHAMTRGMLAHSSGRPFIHLGPIALMNNLDEHAGLFKLFGNRVAQKQWSSLKYKTTIKWLSDQMSESHFVIWLLISCSQ